MILISEAKLAETSFPAVSKSQSKLGDPGGSGGGAAPPLPVSAPPQQPTWYVAPGTGGSFPAPSPSTVWMLKGDLFVVGQGQSHVLHQVKDTKNQETRSEDNRRAFEKYDGGNKKGEGNTQLGPRRGSARCPAPTSCGYS